MHGRKLQFLTVEIIGFVSTSALVLVATDLFV